MEVYTLNNEKIHSLYLNIKSYLQNNNNEDALKCKIRQFIHNEFKELELLEDKYVEKWGVSEKSRQ